MTEDGQLTTYIGQGRGGWRSHALAQTQLRTATNPFQTRDEKLGTLIEHRLGLPRVVLDHAKAFWNGVDKTHARKGGRTDNGLAVACTHLALKTLDMECSIVKLLDACPMAHHGEVKAWIDWFAKCEQVDHETPPLNSSNVTLPLQPFTEVVVPKMANTGDTALDFLLNNSSALKVGTKFAHRIIRGIYDAVKGSMSKRNPATKAGAVALAYRAWFANRTDPRDVNPLVCEIAPVTRTRKHTIVDAYRTCVHPMLDRVMATLCVPRPQPIPSKQPQKPAASVLLEVSPLTSDFSTPWVASTVAPAQEHWTTEELCGVGTLSVLPGTSSISTTTAAYIEPLKPDLSASMQLPFLDTDSSIPDFSLMDIDAYGCDGLEERPCKVARV